MLNEVGMAGYPVEVKIVPGRAPEVDTVSMAEGEKFDVNVMRLNTPEEVLLANMEKSIRRQLPQIFPHNENPQHLAIVGGGWSLNDTVEDLRRLYFDDVKIVAMNGSAKWLMERNLRPSMYIMVDGRPENAEFVREPIPGCKYLIASQCAPEVFDMLEGREVYIFHATGEICDPENTMLDEFYEKKWTRVPPAGMVGITSILLLRVLGFKFLHLFGIDGCFDPRTGAHHGFPQAMNDGDSSMMLKLKGSGKEFRCSPALAASVVNFTNVIAVNGEVFSLAVYGDGLIAHIIKFGATAADIQQEGV